MVGAIADWFAVTALFKHPLGLPIPHTALIPRRKDELGTQPRGVRRRELPAGGRSSASGSRAATISQRVGRVADRARPTPAGWSTRSPTSPRSGCGKVRDEHVADAGRARRWCRGSARSRSRRSLGGLLDGDRRATTRTTGWSTWPSRRCTAGWCTTRRRSPRCSGSGRPGGRRRGSTTRSPHRLHLELVALGRATSAHDPHHHARAGAGLDAARSSPTTCCTTRRPRSAPSGSRTRLLEPPAGARSPSIVAVERAAPRAARRRSTTPTAPLRAPALRASSRRFGERLGRDDGAAGAAGRAAPPTLAVFAVDALRRRADRGDHPHHRALGRQGGRPQDRAARRPRPAVHPDQRHHRRRPGRRADPRRVAW